MNQVTAVSGVLFTIAGDLGGSGIGAIAAHEVAGLAEAGVLGCVACMGASADADYLDRVRTVRFVPRGALPFVSDRTFYLVRNRWFDRKATRLVDSYESLHAWSAQCPGAVMHAASKARRVVLHRASTHVADQCERLHEEYARWGIRPVMPFDSVVRRCIEEYDAAATIVVPSEFARRSFVDKGVSPDKIAVNRYGVDAARFSPGQKAPGGGVNLLFVGEVGVRKGAPRLLRIFDRLGLANATLHLAGSVKPEVEPLCRSYRERDDIVFHGFSGDVAVLFANADVFVFPTVEDGFGMVVTEAMAAGVPVVVSDRAGAAEVVGGGGVVVDLDDEDAWVEAIRALASDADARLTMGERARAIAEEMPWRDFGARAAALHIMDGTEVLR